MKKSFYIIAIINIFTNPILAQSGNPELPPARGKLTDTISQVIQTLGSKDFHLEITEIDKKSIVKEGQEFKIAKSLRLKALLNLPVIIKDAVVKRMLKSGKPYGFKIAKIKKDSIYNYLGVKAGDILRTVDELPITTEKEAMAVFNSVKMKEVVTVMLERGGKEVVYVYRFV